MFKRILIPLDGSPSSDHALKQALSLARLTSASLTALSVVEKLPAYAATVGEVQDAKQEIDAFFAQVHATAREHAMAAGVSLDTAIRAGHAARVIVRFAVQGGFDLIVVGAGGQHGLGGTADKVVETAPCSVLTVRTLPLSVRVGDVMSTEVIAVEPATPLIDVAKLLIEKPIKAVPVVESGRIVGIITGGDLLRRAGMGLRVSLQRKLPAEDITEQLHALAQPDQTAADVMTSPAVTIPAETMASEAVRLMVDRELKRLPVVDQRGTLVGIISRTDVLAAVASGASTEEEIPAFPTGLIRTAGDLAVRDVPVVGPGASLSEVLDKLVATPLRRVVVVDPHRRVLGIILDGELLARINRQQKPDMFHTLLAYFSDAPTPAPPLTGSAADVMSHEVFRVREDTPFVEVTKLMLEKHVKRLVVTDAEDRLVGIVDRRSLLHVIADDI